MMRFLAYNDLGDVGILDRNRRALSEDQNEFRKLLVSLEKCDVKLSYWELLSS